MGIFSSKTKYYVSSSSCPAFDPDTRLDHFQALMLDWTANYDDLDQSEYVKNYYNTSRMRKFNSWIDWCTKNNFTDVFGKITSTIYGDATFNNTVITEAIKPYVDLEPDDVFQVFRTDLNFFSEDFYVRYLATQQGKAYLFYQTSNPDYELTFPDERTVVAAFASGETITGQIPEYEAKTRFLEISYSVIRTYVIGQENPETGELEENVIYDVIYGYYHYKEGSGNSTLDSLIKNNSSEAKQSFFPCVPLRTNTAWYSGDKATLIGQALARLELTNKTNDPDGTYKEFIDALTEGMSSGSMGDIDYITLQLGVALNSKHNSDAAYMYAFFRNLYANYALKQGLPPSTVWKPKSLNTGGGFLSKFFKNIWNKFANANHSDSFFTKFQITCASSNLNLTYSWGGADYFESNGKFKPGAKQGDYGVLTGKFSHSYTVKEPARDNEGNIIHICNEGECEIVYEDVTYTVQYTATLFCHQAYANRWRFILFMDLSEYNLIYHGKGCEYWAYDVIMDAKTKGTVVHDFAGDLELVPGHGSSKMTFYYVKEENDLDSGFIVPLEEGSLKEIGYRHQLQVAYGSPFLVINCWVKKKKKWYQHGIIGSIIGAVAVVIGVVISVVSYGALSYLGYAIAAAGAGLFLVSTLGQKLLNMVLKVCTALFGDTVGNWVYDLIKNLIQVVIVAVSFYYGGPAGAAAAAAAFAATTSYLTGSSLGASLAKGIFAGAMTYAGGSLFNTYGSSLSEWVSNFGLSTEASVAVSAGITTGVTGAAGALASGQDVADAFLIGLLSGAAMGAFNYVKNNFFNGDIVGDIIKYTPSGGESASIEAGTTFQDFISGTIFGQVKDFFLNPNSYVNLMQLSLEQQQIHKMANLENDYKEFNNALGAAQDIFDSVKDSNTSSITAEYVCKLQTNIGRMTSNSPEMMAAMSPSDFLSFSLASGIEIARLTSASVSTFTDNKLSMVGYSASPLYFTQVDPALGI